MVAKMFIILWFLLLCCSVYADPVTIRILGPQSAEDTSQDYYHRLLALALNSANDKKYKIQVVDGNSVTQGRTIHLLNGKFIDVYWMGTSIKREKQFKAIRIPLLKGLLGYRVAIINKAQKAQFTQLDAKGLKSKVACQGTHWPDTQILKSNGFSVIPVARYELMFDLVDINRCDYFPRAIFEGYSELQQANKRLANLTMFDDSILHYPFPIFFFVHQDATELAKDIEQGLEKAIDSGEFDKLLRTHSVTKHLFPITKWQGTKLIELTNPFLGKNLDLNNARYWLKLIDN